MGASQPLDGQQRPGTAASAPRKDGDLAVAGGGVDSEQRASPMVSERHRMAGAKGVGWPRWRIVSYLREAGQTGGLFPLLWLGYGIEVRDGSGQARSRSPASS